MKAIVVFITILCLCVGIATAASEGFFKPMPAGGICTPDGKNLNPDEMRTKRVVDGALLFIPMILVVVGACFILLTAEGSVKMFVGDAIFAFGTLIFILSVFLVT